MEFTNKVVEFMEGIPDIAGMQVSPIVFSGDIEAHDCDNCKCSPMNQGDIYDEGVCRDCWKQAIIKSATRSE